MRPITVWRGIRAAVKAFRLEPVEDDLETLRAKLRPNYTLALLSLLMAIYTAYRFGQGGFFTKSGDRDVITVEGIFFWWWSYLAIRHVIVSPRDRLLLHLADKIEERERELLKASDARLRQD